MNRRLLGHNKIALLFSGGKDSTACVYLFREYLDRITIYHNDTGDLLPEMRESVRRVEAFAPNFVRVNTNVTGWIEHNGLPTDLLPYSMHPVGLAMGEPVATKLVSRYDCCFANLMWPLLERVRDDGNTLLIRGTKLVDMNQLPAGDGDILEGIELYYPIQNWTNEQVFAYLRYEGVELPRIYQYVTQGPDCARCSAWWSEQRASYLKQFYPEIWAQYDARLQLIINEIAPALAMLKREAEAA